MASSSDVPQRGETELSEADLAQTWKELQKGEKTAQALENNLMNLEKKLDDLLASFEESERAKLDNVNAKDLSKVSRDRGATFDEKHESKDEGEAGKS